MKDEARCACYALRKHIKGDQSCKNYDCKARRIALWESRPFRLEHGAEYKGINKKIDQNEWNSIVKNIVSGVKSGDWVKNLSESIIHCGDLLEKHFPIKADDKNELRDEIVMLEN